MVCVGTGAAGVVLPVEAAGCDVGGGVGGEGAVARVRCAVVHVANIRRRISAKIRLIIGNSIKFCGFCGGAFLKSQFGLGGLLYGECRSGYGGYRGEEKHIPPSRYASCRHDKGKQDLHRPTSGNDSAYAICDIALAAGLFPAWGDPRSSLGANSWLTRNLESVRAHLSGRHLRRVRRTCSG